MITSRAIFYGLSIFCLTSLLMFACTQEIDPDPTELIGRWQLTEIVYNDSTITKPNPYKEWFQVEIEFLDDGHIRGTSTMNTFGGLYEVSPSDSITIFLGLESKIGEMNWGRLFGDAIPYVKTYTLRDNRLYLNYDRNKLILKKVK